MRAAVRPPHGCRCIEAEERAAAASGAACGYVEAEERAAATAAAGAPPTMECK